MTLETPTAGPYPPESHPEVNNIASKRAVRLVNQLSVQGGAPPVLNSLKTHEN